MVLPVFGPIRVWPLGVRSSSRLTLAGPNTGNTVDGALLGSPGENVAKLGTILSLSYLRLNTGSTGYVRQNWTPFKLFVYSGHYWRTDRILPPCNYCHHPWCVGDKCYHKALLIMFSCDGISGHASWNEVLDYWDTKLSCHTTSAQQFKKFLHAII